MEVEQISESAYLDVFTSLKTDKNKSYITVEDFNEAVLKYKPKCLEDYLEDLESLK